VIGRRHTEPITASGSACEATTPFQAPLQMGRAEVAVHPRNARPSARWRCQRHLGLVHEQKQLAIAILAHDLSRGYCSDGAGGSVLAPAWLRVK
jgi:hypothetical protein